MKKSLKFLIKLFLGIGILVFLFSKTSVKEFIYLLGNANYKYFVFGIFLYVIGQCFSAKKWMIISKRLLFENPYLRYLRLYFLGMFYNSFLPTNIGGDVVKVVKLADNKDNPINRAIISVLSCRISGLIVLSLIIIIGLFFYHSNFIINMVNLGILFGTFVSIIIAFYLYHNEQIIPEKYKSLYDYTKLLFERHCLLKVILLSVIFHIFLLLIHFSIGRMYNLNIPVTYYLLLHPMASIAASLPISINGLGVKEFVYVYMLKLFEIDTSTAILFAITYNMVMLFSNMLGFIPFIMKDKQPEPEAQ